MKSDNTEKKAVVLKLFVISLIFFKCEHYIILIKYLELLARLH